MAVCAKGHGVVNFSLNGVVYSLESDSDLEISPTLQAREDMENGEFTVTKRSAYISGTLRVPNAQSVKVLQELCGVAVTVELYNGRVFYMASAANTAEDAYNPKQNTLPIKLIGDYMEEVVAA